MINSCRLIVVLVVIFTWSTVSAVTLKPRSSQLNGRNLVRERRARRHGVHMRVPLLQPPLRPLRPQFPKRTLPATSHGIKQFEQLARNVDDADYQYDGTDDYDIASLTKHEGLMDIYTDPYDQELLLIDFTRMLDAPTAASMLASATYAKGTFSEEKGKQRTVYHDPVADDTMLRFSLSGDATMVDVIRPRLSVRTSDKQATKGVNEGTWTGWAGSLPLVYMKGASENATFVDASNLILNGFYLFGWNFDDDIGSYRIQKVRCFPSNIEVTVEMQVLDNDGVTYVPIEVSFTMLKLPDVPMAARNSDDRLGYFTVDFLDMGVHESRRHHLLSDEVDIQYSWITRVNLTSVQNQGKIRFYVDPTVPERWRSSFKEGIEAWNAAFAEIGHPNAVKAILPESEEWPQDYDPFDARFSTISWSTDPDSVYSMGLAKVDPRSGEIVKSDIIFTAGWVHSYLEELDFDAPSVMHEAVGYRREARKRRKRRTSAKDQRQQGGWRDAAPGANTKDKVNVLLRNRASSRLSEDQRSTEQLFSFSPMAFAAANANVSEAEWEKYIGVGLGAVVMHEVGHCLGARHNFKASTAISTSCLSSANCTKTYGLSASIMDYVPVNLFAFKELENGEERPDIFQTTVGEYDKLLIRYGYGDSSWEQGVLVVEKASDMPMCTDEDRTFGVDPYCQVHEMASNPLKYYEEKLRFLRIEMKHLLNLSVGPGESYTRYGEAVLSALNRVLSVGEMLSTYIGGVSTLHLHRNSDSTYRNQSATCVVPDHIQRDALNMIIDILNASFLERSIGVESSRYLVRRKGQIGTGSIDFKQEVSTLQRDLVELLTGSSVLKRLYASQSYAQTTFSIDIMLDELAGTIWGSKGDLLSDHLKWDMQSIFVGQLKDFYLSHCQEFISLDALSTVFLRLQAYKEHVDSHLQTLVGIVGKNNSKAFAYLTYLQSLLSDVTKPCDSAKSVAVAYYTLGYYYY